MKNGGQQKYLDKALVMEQNRFIQRNKEIQQQPLGGILKKGGLKIFATCLIAYH